MQNFLKGAHASCVQSAASCRAIFLPGIRQGCRMSHMKEGIRQGCRMSHMKEGIRQGCRMSHNEGRHPAGMPDFLHAGCVRSRAFSRAFSISHFAFSSR